MRSVWKGHISFGLVNVPVSMHPAERRGEPDLHMVDARNFARVRYERVNEETGEEVPWDRIVHGYEDEHGHYVLIGRDELREAAPEPARTIGIEAFVDLAEIDHLHFDKPYYLEPDRDGGRGYALLREALRETGCTAIARVVIRARQHLGAMVVRGDALVLHLLRYRQELRSMEDLDLPSSDLDEIGVTDRELRMAHDLVESMTEAWDPSKYHDEYREALMQWIERRIEQGEVERVAAVRERAEAPPVMTIADALEESLARRASSSKRRAARRKKKAG